MLQALPFFPARQAGTYDINEIKPNQQIMMELYPEIYSCIGCNACTKSLHAEPERYAVHRIRTARRA